jgi:hypothetical protein
MAKKILGHIALLDHVNCLNDALRYFSVIHSSVINLLSGYLLSAFNVTVRSVTLIQRK